MHRNNILLYFGVTSSSSLKNKLLFLSLSLLIVFGLIGFAQPTAHAFPTDIYVSNSGSDSNSGTSWASAYQTNKEKNRGQCAIGSFYCVRCSCREKDKRKPQHEG